MTLSDLSELTAVAAAAAIRAKRLSSHELTTALLKKIEREEPSISAWTYIGREQALAEAAEADRAIESGSAKSSLHGVPIGIKDIFDTADMPTEYGTPIHAGRRPQVDSAVVKTLKEAGMVVLGKTVTTELASYSAGKTRNPHNLEHTPGGSSSGSAAAVAACMVPLATGSQTHGSVIRPASFCGVYGYKPSYGTISRHGVLTQSRRLDHVGVFARSLEDIAQLSAILMTYDARDPDMLGPRSLEKIAADMLGTRAKSAPRLGFAKTASWPRAEPSTQSAFLGMIARLEGRIEEVALPPEFDSAVQLLTLIMEVDMGRNYAKEYNESGDRLSAMIRKMIGRGIACSRDEYERALAQSAALAERLQAILAPFDAVLTPATCGEAPHGLGYTGDPGFCSLWTLCGVPALSVPLLSGPAGLPLGVQMVSARGEDANLMNAAEWLVTSLKGEARASASARIGSSA